MQQSTGPASRMRNSKGSGAQETTDVLDALGAHCRHLERNQERHRVIIDDLRSHITKLEDHYSKGQADLAYAQQQLEYVVVSLEREHGILADHTEQLRLFAGESRGNAGGDAGAQYNKSILLMVGGWLYMPVVHFAKGVYTLFAPIINTAQSLSLLNSEVLQRFADEHVRSRWGDARNGDLLGKLQKGSLDPPSVSNRKIAS